MHRMGTANMLTDWPLSLRLVGCNNTDRDGDAQPCSSAQEGFSMLLQHATPRNNLRSIFRIGLQPGLARGKLRAVWLHTVAKSSWAVKHVSKRHDVEEENVVVLIVKVPRSMLRRNRRGVWYCPRLIIPEQIYGAKGLKIFAA
jgi:hypothetical protein